MSLLSVKPIWKVGIVFYIIALIVYIVGFATPEWYTLNKTAVFGLFRVCDFTLIPTVCYDVDNLPPLRNGLSKSNLWVPSQAVLATGLAALVVGGALVVVAAAVDKLPLTLPGGLLIIIGGVFGLAGGIFFMVKGTDVFDEVYSYTVNYSSIILLLASIGEIISAFLLLAGRPSRAGVGP